MALVRRSPSRPTRPLDSVAREAAAAALRAAHALYRSVYLDAQAAAARNPIVRGLYAVDAAEARVEAHREATLAVTLAKSAAGPNRTEEGGTPDVEP